MIQGRTRGLRGGGGQRRKSPRRPMTSREVIPSGAEIPPSRSPDLNRKEQVGMKRRGTIGGKPPWWAPGSSLEGRKTTRAVSDFGHSDTRRDQYPEVEGELSLRIRAPRSVGSHKRHEGRVPETATDRRVEQALKVEPRKRSRLVRAGSGRFPRRGFKPWTWGAATRDARHFRSFHVLWGTKLHESHRAGVKAGPMGSRRPNFEGDVMPSRDSSGDITRG
jgi:hypothetical protein